MGLVRGVMVGLAVLLATAACADQGAEASDKKPRLVDHTGTVEESRFRFTVNQPIPNGVWPAIVEAPKGWDLRVVWRAGPCHTAATVEVRGSAGQISSIELDRGPWVSPGENIVCPDNEEHHVVDLKTSVEPPTDIEVHF